MDKKNKNSMVSSKLTKLRDAYRQRLVSELVEIETLSLQLQSTRISQPMLHSLHQMLHKLAGSAGTFDFGQLGQQARFLECTVQEWLLDAALPANETIVARFIQEIQSLRASLLADDAAAGSIALEAMEIDNNAKIWVIWLVERDLILADYILHQLQSFGFTVYLFNDITEIAHSLAKDPDLLIIDHHAAREADTLDEPYLYWRQQLEKFTCPVIFTGGQENFKARMNAVRAGAMDYFVKPLDMPKLAARIARLLKDRGKKSERILIVDEDTKEAKRYARLLKDAGMEVCMVHKPDQLLARAKQFQPELLLIELHLSDIRGSELAALMRQFDKWKDLVILFLSSEPCQEVRTEALMMGGDDFLIKPIPDALLINSCRNRVQRLRELQKASTRDGLTGLVKHTSIKEALATEFLSARRRGSPLSVAMVDIDRFKQINDSHGHGVGDVVIGTVGTLLRQYFRSTDWLGRYGGEEFLVVLLDCHSDTALKLLDNFREAFSAIWFVGDEQSFSCTLSAGIANTTDFQKLNAEQLLEKADRALYFAKDSGRNQVCLAKKDT